MSGQSVRLLDSRVLAANQTSPREQVIDLGAYREMNIQIRVLRAGTANDVNTWVWIQHAGANDEDAFQGINATQVRVDSTAPTTPVFVQVTAFMRYIRWQSGSGSFAGNPVVLIDIVAKD